MKKSMISFAKNKKRIIIYLLVLLSFTVFLYSRAGNQVKSSAYTYAFKQDIGFFNKKDFDPCDFLSEDNNLNDEAFNLLLSKIEHEGYNSIDSDIYISEENYEYLDTNPWNSDNDVKFTGLYAFVVLKKNRRAIVAFRYDTAKHERKESQKNALENYKTYPYDRIYLELDNNEWKVVEVIRSA